MQFMLKGAGLWRIVSGDEAPPPRPDLNLVNPNPSSSSGSRNSRSSAQQSQQQQQQPVQQPQDDASYQQYQTRCDLAASYIYSSLSAEARKFLGAINEPRPMWNILKNWLNTLSREVGITRTHTNFLNDKMKDNESLSTYISRLTGYQTELMNTRKGISDEDLVTHLLTFVSTKYHNIRRHIWDRPLENQTLDYVRNTLLEHEAQINLDPPIVETTALAIRNGRRFPKKNHQSQNRQKDGSDQQAKADQQEDNSNGFRCYHCLRKGHLQSECRLKKKSQQFRKRQRQQRQQQSSTSNI